LPILLRLNKHTYNTTASTANVHRYRDSTIDLLQTHKVQKLLFRNILHTSLCNEGHFLELTTVHKNIQD